MLQQLTIENFITIRNFSIDFFSGLTVFTGESGVGKSVIFSAIYSLLGQPLSVNMIRPASDMLSCEAVLDIKTLSNFIYPELLMMKGF